MIRNNKLKIILSSVVILLPILIGLILWNELPDKIATHWGFGGEANGWSSKPFAVFFIPAFMLAIHLVCLIASSFDKKNEGQSKKALSLIFWICPVISLFTNAVIYASAMGISFNMDSLMLTVLGLSFIIIGNYLPKCKQNRTMGIKLKWTLKDEENWNATHRFGGKVWVIGGILLMLCAFLPSAAEPYALLIILSALIIIPIAYSYAYFKNKQ